MAGLGQYLVRKIYHFFVNRLFYSHLTPINISTSSAIYPWQPAAWLRVSGDDAATFLQGQFTNELRGLPPGGAAYGLWLTIKGKVLADSFVIRGRAEKEWWVGSYFSPAEIIRKRLEDFVIADDVVIEDVTAAWMGASVLANEAGGGAVEEAKAAVGDSGVVFRGRRVRAGNVEVVVPRDHFAAVRARFGGAVELDEGTIEVRRIADAIPAVPRDIGPGDLPNEGGLEMDAISYTKGCYLGQEVMARLKSMGQVRRRLVGVRIGAETVPAMPAPLFLGGKQVGELKSAAKALNGDGAIGLAMVSLLNVKAGATLGFAADAAPTVIVGELP